MELSPGFGALKVPHTEHFINSPPKFFGAADPEDDPADPLEAVAVAAPDSASNSWATPFNTTPKMARTREITNTLTKM